MTNAATLQNNSDSVLWLLNKMFHKSWYNNVVSVDITSLCCQEIAEGSDKFGWPTWAIYFIMYCVTYSNLYVNKLFCWVFDCTHKFTRGYRIQSFYDRSIVWILRSCGPVFFTKVLFVFFPTPKFAKCSINFSCKIVPKIN